MKENTQKRTVEGIPIDLLKQIEKYNAETAPELTFEECFVKLTELGIKYNLERQQNQNNH